MIITIILSLSTAMWMGVAPYKSFDLIITPKIYSPECNIGVLNELAIFEMHIRNELSTNEDIEITITADDEVILNKIIAINANSSRNETITQRLSNVGMWKIQGIHNEGTIDSYSFKTLTNTVEAEIEIQGLAELERKTNQDFINLLTTIIVSIATVTGTIIGILNYRKGRKKVTNYQSMDY